MPKKPDERIVRAKQMYKEGMKLVEIAKQLELPEGTVRRWKSTHNWDNERSDNNSERSHKCRGTPNGSKKASKKAKEVQLPEIDELLENDELTEKQRLFCFYYTKWFNATKAYQKAYGCGYTSAMVGGSQALRKPKIKAQIQKIKSAKIKQCEYTMEDTFQKMMDIAYSDITDYLDFGQESISVIGEGEILTKDVNYLRFKESSVIDGTLIQEIKQGSNGASIKLMDRFKALEWLTANMGLANEAQKAKIAHLNAQIKNLTQTENEQPINITFSKASTSNDETS